jgi:transposase
MVVLGVDAHKRSHTVVAIDDLGRKVGERTTGTTNDDHLASLAWAEKLGADRWWAVEDCRHLSRRLERDLVTSAVVVFEGPASA